MCIKEKGSIKIQNLKICITFRYLTVLHVQFIIHPFSNKNGEKARNIGQDINTNTTRKTSYYVEHRSSQLTKSIRNKIGAVKLDCHEIVLTYYKKRWKPEKICSCFFNLFFENITYRYVWRFHKVDSLPQLLTL